MILITLIIGFAIGYTLNFLLSNKQGNVNQPLLSFKNNCEVSEGILRYDYVLDRFGDLSKYKADICYCADFNEGDVVYNPNKVFLGCGVDV